jgi:hypothetical protein
MIVQAADPKRAMWRDEATRPHLMCSVADAAARAGTAPPLGQPALRLAGCALLRALLWGRLPWQSRDAVEAAEAFALVPAGPLHAAGDMMAACALHKAMHEADAWARRRDTPQDQRWPTDRLLRCLSRLEGLRARDIGLLAFDFHDGCKVLRHALGDPWRERPAPSAAWRTPEVRRLAWAAARHRPGGKMDPARLAVLSDCLEEAGCPTWHATPDRAKPSMRTSTTFWSQ